MRTMARPSTGFLAAIAALLCLALGSAAAHAAQPTPKVLTPAEQRAALESDDPRLARNKRHVFDFWRIVYEGGHVDQAEKYMAPEYIQHNPNLPSGRQTFVDFFRKQRPAKPVADHMKMPVIAILAERDLVSVFSARKVRDRANPDHVYYITWFDMFRIDANGLIAEHWDPSETWVNGLPPGAEFFAEWDK
jgi:predicted SnoaL-like aldol condensation-catalyzing enzyme